jgi:cell division topological specificity factor
MSFFNWRQRRGSAPVARDRLKVLLAHERLLGPNSDLLVTLRDDILALICRHLMVVPENVHVRMESGKTRSTLAIDVEVPLSPVTARRVKASGY